MCELLVRVGDKKGTDSEKDFLQSFRGDVIDIFEDGTQYGAATLKNPDWLIVKMPGVPRTEMLDLLEPEWKEEADGSRTVVRKRARCFDLDKMDTTALATLSAAAETVTVDASLKTALDASKTTKATFVVKVG